MLPFIYKNSDPDNDLTLQQYLNDDEKDNENIQRVAKQLNIEHLLNLSFVKLSNGQTRRARIARALLRNPSMLVLDEPLSKRYTLYKFFFFSKQKLFLLQ